MHYSVCEGRTSAIDVKVPVCAIHPLLGHGFRSESLVRAWRWNDWKAHDHGVLDPAGLNVMPPPFPQRCPLKPAYPLSSPAMQYVPSCVDGQVKLSTNSGYDLRDAHNMLVRIDSNPSRHWCSRWRTRLTERPLAHPLDAHHSAGYNPVVSSK